MRVPEVASLPVAVLLLGEPGCPACEMYEPIFREVAGRYARCVPAFVVQCSAYPDQITTAREPGKIHVGLIPTTAVFRYGQIVGKKAIGVLDKDAVERVFARAMRGQGCEIGEEP